MYEIQRRKGRLLTASSLALAVILTTGASSAWAQSGNVTGVDPNTGIITGSGGADQTLFLSKVQDPTATTITGKLGTDVTAKKLTTDSTAATAIKVESNTGVYQTLSLIGEGGNLVQNDNGQALDLEIGSQTGVEVAGRGGSLETVTLTDSTSVLKGSGSGAALNIGKLNLNGGSLIGDPPFGTSQMSYDPSTVMAIAAGEVSGTDGRLIDGRLFVMENTHITVGSEDSGSFAANAIRALERDSSLRWTNNTGIETAGNAMTAAFAVTKTGGLLLDNTVGELNVDGSLPTGSPLPALQAGSATFADNSLLIVDNAAIGNNAAIANNNATPAGTATVGDDATLYIVNAKVDGTAVRGQGTTTILDNFGTVTDNSTAGHEAWAGKHLQYDTRLVSAVNNKADFGTDGVTVTNQYNGAAQSYAAGRISNGMANAIDGVFLNGDNNINSANAGLKFVSRATSSLYLDSGKSNDRQVVTTLEGAAAMASTAGVQTSTYSISNTLAENYNARLSYLRDTAPAAGSGEAGTIGIWINPFYNFSDVDGVKIGRNSAEYEFNYGGATIGLDSNINDNFRLGLAFSAGGGDTESKGHKFNKTESDFDFWGLGVYGSYTNGMFGLTGDISYSSTSYDIDQRLPSAMGMNKLTADVDTDALTVGLTGEYRFLTSNNLNIIPHLGLRYTNLKTDSYRIKEKGVGNVFRVSSETQNIWTIPLGVTFTGEVATSSDWVIQPKADLGVIFAAGDLDADSKFRLNDRNYGGRITADDVVDTVTFNGLVGLKAENCDGFSVGLDYNFKASDNLTSHGVTGTIRYDF